MVRYGRGRVRLLRKHPETLSLSCLLPALFLAGVVVGPLLAFWSSLLAFVYFSVLGIYGVTLVLYGIALSVSERDAMLLPLFPLVFLTIHAGAGAGVWCELLLGAPPSPAVPSPQALSKVA
jgi:hypothetical protein